MSVAAKDRRPLSEAERRWAGENLGLAHFATPRRARNPDSIQDARLALCESLLCWDPTRGASVPTWAVQFIRYARGRWNEVERRRIKPWLFESLDFVPVEHEWPDLDPPIVIAEALRLLDARQRAAVEMRYFRGFTLREIGRALGVTQERARQIILRAERVLSEAIALTHPNIREVIG